MPQINASFPSEVIEQVNKMKSSEKNVRSFSEMVLILVEEALLTRQANKTKNK